MDIYDNFAEKFLIHKSKFNQTDDIGQKILHDLIGNFEGKYILDYGCGSGDISINNLSKNPKLILGVDISKELLQHGLEKTKNISNMEFMSIDSNNKSFDQVITNNFFNHIVSYYVFCTLESLDLINSIISSFYKKLKQGGSVLLLMPNRDKFNGKTCYGFSFIKKEYLNDGDSVITFLRTEVDTPLPTIDDPNSNHLRLNDYFRSQEALTKVFEKNGFIVEIQEVFVDGNSYHGIIDENTHSPMYILKALKQ